VGDDPAHPKRQFDTYFRVCATDNFRGPYAADYLVRKAGKKKIAIVQDDAGFAQPDEQTRLPCDTDGTAAAKHDRARR
jgi:ABC-type branched-subunit amino acid transport system substrate-binding protein